MTNINKNNSPDQPLPDPDSNLQQNLNARPSSSNDSEETVTYRDGYVHGRAVENHIQGERQAVRDDNNVARGLLIGITVAALVGLAVGAIFLFSPREEEEITPVVVPSPTEPEQPTNETTIIERETVREVPVPVPQPEEPATENEAPDVNVTVPPSQPQQQPAPEVNNNTTVEVQPSQPSTQNDSSTPENTTPSQSTNNSEASSTTSDNPTPQREASNSGQ